MINYQLAAAKNEAMLYDLMLLGSLPSERLLLGIHAHFKRISS
jgi:hypothetical protein